MRQRRIKLTCECCGTRLRWTEDAITRGLIFVEPCPTCVGNLTKEEKLKYEKKKQEKKENNQDIPYQC